MRICIDHISRYCVFDFHSIELLIQTPPVQKQTRSIDNNFAVIMHLNHTRTQSHAYTGLVMVVYSETNLNILYGMNVLHTFGAKFHTNTHAYSYARTQAHVECDRERQRGRVKASLRVCVCTRTSESQLVCYTVVKWSNNALHCMSVLSVCVTVCVRQTNTKVHWTYWRSCSGCSSSSSSKCLLCLFWILTVKIHTVS